MFSARILVQVTHSFCKEFLHLLIAFVGPSGDLPVTDVLTRLFDKAGKARSLSQAYHRYALNYINALNYLESLRRHQEFCDFEKVCVKLNGHPRRCSRIMIFTCCGSMSPNTVIVLVVVVVRATKVKTIVFGYLK